MYSFAQCWCVKTQTRKVSSQSFDSQEAKTSPQGFRANSTLLSENDLFQAPEGSVRLTLKAVCSALATQCHLQTLNCYDTVQFIYYIHFPLIFRGGKHRGQNERKICRLLTRLLQCRVRGGPPLTIFRFSLVKDSSDCLKLISQNRQIRPFV